MLKLTKKMFRLLDVDRMYRHMQYTFAAKDSRHIWLCSYPRSGNTWVRYLLNDVLNGVDDDYGQNTKYSIPDIHSGLTYIKSGQEFDFIKSHFKRSALYKKVVYIVRDPIDVLQSYMVWEQRFFSRHVDQDVFMQNELQARSPYGCWKEHVLSYLTAGYTPNDILWLKYEDMLLDPVSNIQKILTFSGHDVPDEIVLQSVEKHMDELLVKDVINYSSYDEKVQAVYDHQVGKGRHSMHGKYIDMIIKSDISVVANALGYDLCVD